ncbi:V-type proton ATPase subunit H [Geodia barretti]|uniref:V-type proton ATPase subunit H n=3 Tax=Geodia barretti TaxID=519541 RepID=A0AA35RVP3_GEOBA|nr:V-type proton ATPase subunit H [Geodia barretti]
MANYKPLTAVIETVQQSQAETNAAASYNKIHIEAEEIRQRPFSFKEFYRNKQISENAYSFGEKYLQSTRDEKRYYVKKYPYHCVELFASMVEKVHSVEPLQYVLTLLADLTDDEKNVTLIVKTTDGDQLYRPLLSVFHKNDKYSKHQASLVIARLWSHTSERIPADNVNQYLGWTVAQLSRNPDYLLCVTKALMTFLRKESYRMAFISANGIKPIVDLLDRRITFQLQYQLVFCVWMLSFQSDVVEKMKEYPMAAVLCDVLRATNREKVQRVIFATFRNLLEKPRQSVAEQFAAEMIHFKAVPVLNILVQQTKDDVELQEDIVFLHERLNASLQDLSSWDEYAAEVKSGRLEWSPVHRSDKFWRENVMKLNENNHEILKTLVLILQESQSAVAIAVAAHDLGEYVRYYPRGKRNLDALGAKEMVMGMVSHGNADVRMQALLAIQKMMVQNWEYLGRQLTEDAGSTPKTVELR